MKKCLKYDAFEALIVIKEMINLLLQISEDSVHLYRVFFCVLKVDQGDGVPSSFCKGLNIEEDRGNTYTKIIDYSVRLIQANRNLIKQLSLNIMYYCEEYDL